MRIKLFVTAVLLFISFALALADVVFADSRIGYNATTTSCPMVENTQININFNSRQTDLTQIKSLMDDKLKEAEALANKAGIDKFELQSMNYNIYANNSGGCNCSNEANKNSVYQLNGNMSFIVEPSEKAIDFMVLLNEKGYTSGLNVNKYRRCN